MSLVNKPSNFGMIEKRGMRLSKVNCEVHGHIATMLINSPPANALSTAILDDIALRLDEIENQSSVKVIILKGEGKFFSAGADIKEFTSLQQEDDYQALAEKGQTLFNRIEAYHIPIIAAVHGAALGGGLELAMACHMRIVTEHAKLGLPELTLGIIPGFAGTQRLPQYVGMAKAYEMILSGEPITGKKAFSYGLANQVVAEEELDTTVGDLANKIAAKSKPTISQVMDLIRYSKSSQFSEGLKAEAIAFGEVFGNEDAKEGVNAFIEKRQPKFLDK